MSIALDYRNFSPSEFVKRCCLLTDPHDENFWLRTLTVSIPDRHDTTPRSVEITQDADGFRIQVPHDESTPAAFWELMHPLTHVAKEAHILSSFNPPGAPDILRYGHWTNPILIPTAPDTEYQRWLTGHAKKQRVILNHLKGEWAHSDYYVARAHVRKDIPLRLDVAANGELDGLALFGCTQLIDGELAGAATPCDAHPECSTYLFTASPHIYALAIDEFYGKH